MLHYEKVQMVPLT